MDYDIPTILRFSSSSFLSSVIFSFVNDIFKHNAHAFQIAEIYVIFTPSLCVMDEILSSSRATSNPSSSVFYRILLVLRKYSYRSR